MPKTRRLLTRFSKGELSPLLEGSPDLEGYYQGASILENFKILRQGGIRRWEGTRFIKEVKDSTADTILWPFEFSVDEAYMLEVGYQYIRVYKDKAAVMDGGNQVEIATTFEVADIRMIHFTQSADVLFTFHGDYQQRTLSRASDTEWALSTPTFSPPPSFEADSDLGDTLAPSANSGSAITFRAGSAIFLAADVGRYIIAGLGRALITSLTSTTEVVADILDGFDQTITAGPNALTSVATAVASVAHGAVVGQFALLTSGAQAGQLREIATIVDVDNFTLVDAYTVNQAGVTWDLITPLSIGDWGLRLSPQTTLDPSTSIPVGATVTLVAAAAAFRAADVGKYIKVYGGVIKVTVWDSTTQVRGTLLNEMGDTTLANPGAAPTGTWTLEVSSWSSDNGFPRTGEFFQGRLCEAATDAQPTTIWGSRSDDYENFATGITAEDAFEYTMASRQVNSILWLTEKNKALLLGTGGSEHTATGSGNTDQLIGGDTVPIFDRVATNGCAPIQPIVSRQTAVYVDRSRLKLLAMGFQLDSDGQSDVELTVAANHILTSGVRLGPLAFEKRVDPRLHLVREDGTLVGMTYYPEQKVVGFARRTTEGTFEASAVISNATGLSDQVWTIAKRTINGVEKRYVEMFEPYHEGLTERGWTSMQTDCGIVLTGQVGTTLTGLDHLEGEQVDVIKNGSFIAQPTVSGGAITLTDAAVMTDVFEVGLHYDSTATTMQPSIPGQVIEGLPRTWDSCFVRLYQTRGGTLNGQTITYAASDLDTASLFTGDHKVTPQQVDTSGKVTIAQTQPYPITVLALFGTLSIAEMD